MSRKFHPPKPKKCKKTGKTMFKREKQASYAMMRTWAHDPSMDIYKYHTYSCPSCGHFHFGNRTVYERQMKRTEIEITDSVSIMVD